MKTDAPLLAMLRSMNEAHEKQKANKYPFNDRELAKAELVRSLLKKFDK